jgi:hypothetical protein
MATDSPALTELVVELYRRLNKQEPEPGVIEAIQQVCEDSGLEDDKVPTWLMDMFDAVLAGREVKRVLFPKIGSDISSFFLESAPLIPGWRHDDQGESVVMEFPPIHVRVQLSREALTPEGRACALYSVLLVPTS